MSMWLNDDEVLEGEGKGEAAPVNPRRSLVQRPRPGRGHSPLSSPTNRDTGLASPHAETMGKAKELFVQCDKEGKGFITKRDMQGLQGELPLSPEQLEEVFESLDRESNGFLTPVEFNIGLSELMGLDDAEHSQNYTKEDRKQMMDLSQEPAATEFLNILIELRADKLFNNQQELLSLWYEMQRDRPELLSVLEGILVHAVSHLQDSNKEKHSLEQALVRRESEHDQVVRSIYEEMESQISEERKKFLTQDSFRQKQREQQLEELKLREQELELTLTKQEELERRLQQLNLERANIQEQNQQLQSHNIQLQEQLESSKEQLQTALAQLSVLHLNTAQEQVAKQRKVMNVSRNMQKEKASLLRQLELLRDINKRLRDEKDAQLTPQRSPNSTKTLKKRGSVIGNYLHQDKPLKRQLSTSDELEQDSERTEASNASETQQPSRRVRCENVEQAQTQSSVISPQRVFKVVFLGNSGVGKSTFIQRYCTGHFSSQMSTTVGVDFQMKTIALGSTTIALQLWDTAGQERFRSITEQYYRKADGILAMYDIHQSASFAAVRGWMDTVKEKMCEGAVLMLLGNKLDLAEGHSRKVSTQEGQRLAEQHQALFYECSAKTGFHVEELMMHLAGRLLAQHDQLCEDALLLTEPSPKRSCCT